MISATRREKDIKKFKFFNIVRLAIFLSLTFVSLLILVFVNTNLPIVPIIISLVIATGFSIFNFFSLKLFKFRTTVFFQLFIDIIFITIMVYLSGGINSPFYFLYILPILISAVFLKRRDSLFIASASFIFFGVLSELMYMELIPITIANYHSTVSISNFIYNLIMSFIAFLTVSISSSYYFQKINEAGEELHTVKKNLEDLVLLNHTVMENMDHGFLTSDMDGKIISYNKRAMELLKLSDESNALTLLLADKKAEHLNSMEEGISQLYFEQEVENKILSVSISKVYNISDYKQILVYLVTNLTERKKIEERLNRKQHLAIIGEMAAGIAHEIRNPLASISGSVQFLKNNMELEAETGNLMEIIVKESERLSNFIEEFLGFTKSTPIEKREFNLSNMIDETVELAKIKRENVKFIKVFNKNITVFADENKIKQVVWNLITNAIKAISEQGTIEITIVENEHIVLYLKDSGIGMSPDELNKIFNPFYSTFTSGLGLGMAIVKRIIEEHNLKLTVSSEKNIGTEIKIDFGEKNG